MKFLAPIAFLVMTSSTIANPFFAYSFGFPEMSATEQVDFLSSTGYDGIAADVWSDEQLTEFREMMQTVQVRSGAFKVFGVYFPYKFNNLEHRRLVSEVLKASQSQKVPLWLAIGNEEASEEKIIELLRSVCDEAATYGIEVIYYPHDRHFILSVEPSIRIIKTANRQNLSTSIQLNHELRAGNQDRLEEVIKATVDQSSLATISGALDLETFNTGSRDWSDVIQPLAKSPYDVKPFVDLLRKHGYKGPIGLQNFKIKGDVKAHHRAAIEVWKSWQD